MLFFLQCEKTTSFNFLTKEKIETRYIKPIWLKLNCVFGRLLKWNWIKLDGVLVLFKKIWRKVNVICPIIINVIFIVNLFSIFSMHITSQFALTYDPYFNDQPVLSTGLLLVLKKIKKFRPCFVLMVSHLVYYAEVIIISYM